MGDISQDLRVGVASILMVLVDLFNGLGSGVPNSGGSSHGNADGTMRNFIFALNGAVTRTVPNKMITVGNAIATFIPPVVADMQICNEMT